MLPRARGDSMLYERVAEAVSGARTFSVSSSGASSQWNEGKLLDVIKDTEWGWRGYIYAGLTAIGAETKEPLDLKAEDAALRRRTSARQHLDR